MAYSHSTMKRFCASALLGFLLSTTAVPVIAQTLDELATRGEVLAAADPLAAELRSRLDEAGKRGFDIGMGGTEGDTAYGPGKQARGDALPADQQAGYFKAVEYMVTRNANLEALHTGGRVAQGDPALKEARLAEDDPFYTLGFDIATGLLYNQQGGIGDLSQTVGASGVRATLRGATQRGFDASASLNGRNFVSKPSGSTPVSTPTGDLAVSDGTTDGTGDVDRVGSVPNVVGMTPDEAHLTLSNASYDPEYTEANTPPVRPPYDRVIGSRPAAGTTLRAGSKVSYQLPRAWIQKGGSVLTKNDQDTRLGFDLDTGKYARMDEGADIYATSQEYFKTSPYALDRRKTQVTIHLSPNALFSNERMVTGFDYATAGWSIYEYCKRSFSEPPPNPAKFGGAGRFCIITDRGQTARVIITGTGLKEDQSSYNGEFSFSYITFGANASGTLKAQGRVMIPGAPVKKVPICDAAKLARDRNSPATAGLTKQCLDSGGTVPQ